MSTKLIPNVVSIAGVDPSGGAGIFADIKTFSALGGEAGVSASTACRRPSDSRVHARGSCARLTTS